MDVEMNRGQVATVVVGVDGSPAAAQALRFALADAGRRGARVRVIAAAELPEFWGTMYGRDVPPPVDEIVEAMRAAAQKTVDRVRADAPELAAVPVTVQAHAGPPADVLVAASEDADLLVLGHRGRGRLASTVLGSVGLSCLLHASCPVTVVRTAPVPAMAAVN